MDERNSSSDWENQLQSLLPAPLKTSEAEAMYAMGYAAALAQHKAQQSVPSQPFRIMIAAMVTGMLFAGAGGYWLRDATPSNPSNSVAQTNAVDRVNSPGPVMREIPQERPISVENEEAEATTVPLPQPSATQWLATAISRWWQPANASATWGNSIVDHDPIESSDLTVFVTRQHFVHLIMEPHAGYRRTGPATLRAATLRGKGPLIDSDKNIAADSQPREEAEQPSYLTPATLGRNSALWKDWIQ
jgi:hypothetical protein